MRFHLVYNGSLPSAGNKAKPADVLRIREAFHPQLQLLWETHHALQVLKDLGARPTSGTHFIGGGPPRHMAKMQPDDFEDCLVPLKVGDKHYQPLVRKSLDLNCELQILFLRQQDPGALISQGGDIDGRLKALLDALRMPSRDEQERAAPAGEGLFCLMESDTLVSRLDVDTDRLLFPQTERPHEVHLVIEVSLNVLRVGPHNTCLL